MKAQGGWGGRKKRCKQENRERKKTTQTQTQTQTRFDDPRESYRQCLHTRLVLRHTLRRHVFDDW
jgi:hypothetical protein